MNNTTSGYDTTITPAIATMIVNGETYVNLHNMTNPGGEIRGQVLKTGSCEIVTSIQSEASKQELEIFPNPSKNLINIRSSENIQMIRIISVDGRLIQQQKINSQQQALINIEDLNNGIYLLETVSANGNQISRIIKN
jgi:hypothetical protein